MLQPHTFVKKRYFAPKYCDVCHGILLGAAFKCESCGMRCHLGYGRDNHEDCRAEALWTPCSARTKSTHGSYRFGDVTQQMLRDFRSRARMLVVNEVVSEQKDLGNFAKLKGMVVAFRSQWSRVRINRLLLRWQLGTAACLALLTYAAMLVALGDCSRKSRLLSAVQAASNTSALLCVEGVLAVLVYVAAGRVKRHSVLLHVFLCDVAKVDLTELSIDLSRVSTNSKRIASSTMSVTSLLLVVTSAVWFQCLKSV
eukprot:CAMPEP_0171072918 /NCGR_PEP_ID=MMETSP0766_2-20121228/11177_1 /TAXON_ID=439317 /ORGANISM="Gambierdiscus australes, Strain CAWD 149" /LENGTH=254 /DNA_ID=CAMNT_0011529561 /DNA_START=103 /DNA_END=867 /DNA_ORIENTATION=-